jgi:hypothetical protein
LFLPPQSDDAEMRESASTQPVSDLVKRFGGSFDSDSPSRTNSFDTEDAPCKEEVKRSVVRRRRRNEAQMDSELERILNRRSNYLEDWEKQLQEGGTSDADQQMMKYEERLQHKQKKDAVPKDNELGSVLKARRDLETEEYVHDSDVEVAKIEADTKLVHASSLEVELRPRPALTKQSRLSASPSFRDDVKTSSGVLRKTKTFDGGQREVDPELASVLKLRRQKDKSDDDDDAKASR